MNLVNVAFLYDFDKTLCTKDMQEYEFIPSLGMSAEEFWGSVNVFSKAQKMDSILAYMYCMLSGAKKKNLPITRELLVGQGKSVELFKGVDSWFDRINEYGKEHGLNIEHYVISSGLKEIIEGTEIANKFTRIFASEFLYDDNTEEAIWVKMAVNYTNKTQFVYRINKGVLDVSNHVDLNRSTPDAERRIRFPNMVYFGDGLTDVPCMKLVRSSGGTSIALYNESKTDLISKLLDHNRVDFAFNADYSENSPLERTIFKLLDKIQAENALIAEMAEQRRSE